jgi:manganese/iron transport system permease protein/iron/zinc/copper transport system permease protein
VIHWLTEPWTWQFFRHGVIAAVLAGALTGLVGVYVVLRRMSYIGHGLSHAAFGGAVVGYVLGANFYLVAGAWALVAALLIHLVARQRGIGADAAIGIVTTAAFAIGVAVISQGHHFTRNFDAALFGNILGVSRDDLWILGISGAVVVAVLFLQYKPLLFATFDPEVAPSYGIGRWRADLVLSLVLAATIIVTMRILGVTLVAAAIVIPAAVARLVTTSFARMLIIGTFVGAATGLVGMYASYYADVASGATIVLTSAALFVVVLAATGAQRLRRRGVARALAEATLAGPGAIAQSTSRANSRSRTA